MTRTASKISLSIGLSAMLALPTLLSPLQASAAEPVGDPATTAPIVVVTPPPAAQPTPPPPPPPAYTPAVPGSAAPSMMVVDPRIAELKHRRNSGLGMTISGYTLFGTSYLISALVGTISLDLAADVGGTGVYGRRMLVPLVGPFMAIPRAGTATGGLFTGLLGVVQIGGFALGTAGAIRFGSARRQLALSADTGGLKLQF